MATTGGEPTDAQIRDFLTQEYSRISSDWYADVGDYTPALLEIKFEDCAAGYSQNRNVLQLCISEGNREDFECIFGGQKALGYRLGWYVSQRELVHEMLHEYQYKMVGAPTDEGIALFAKHKRRFPDPGHDATWFTAIALRASYFDVTADQLISEL
jgi:hypothetical protein